MHDCKSSDDSILLWNKRISRDIDILNHDTDSSNSRYDNIPESSLNCENSLQMISDCINKIKRDLEQDKNITKVYACFVNLKQTEMENK